ncbi:MAG TPA: hypothetical protein PKE65_10265 [Rhizobiaceae bacterium]|nr:hypothetical protein [Rhizobiaceae bacterium]
MLTPLAVRRIHRGSALVLGAFLVFHMANHLVALAGIDAHRAMMQAGRAIYSFPPVEALLLVAVVAQVVTGLAQLRASRGRRRGFWPRLQAASGAVLAFFLVAHTLALVVGLRGVFGLDTDFFAAASVLVIWPLPLIYAPYYALGVAALFAHLACVLRLRVRGRDDMARLAPHAIAGLGAAAGVVIVATFSGAFYAIDLPPEYRAPFAVLID